MNREQSESAIRQLYRQWQMTAAGQRMLDPTFADFHHWLRFKGYGHYLTFESPIAPEREARQWFDDEVKRTRPEDREKRDAGRQ